MERLDWPDAFEAAWGPYRPRMSAYVRITVTAAEMILSPAYDLGLTEDELRKTNLEKLKPAATTSPALWPSLHRTLQVGETWPRAACAGRARWRLMALFCIGIGTGRAVPPFKRPGITR